MGQVQNSEEICFFLQVLHFFPVYHHLETSATLIALTNQPKQGIIDLF